MNNINSFNKNKLFFLEKAVKPILKKSKPIYKIIKNSTTDELTLNPIWPRITKHSENTTQWVEKA